VQDRDNREGRSNPQAHDAGQSSKPYAGETLKSWLDSRIDAAPGVSSRAWRDDFVIANTLSET
jgi:hypothetical protein